MTALAAMIAMTMISASGGLAPKALATSRNRVNLSPKGWPAREYARFMEAQGIDRTAAGLVGRSGAFTLAYGGLSAPAGLESPTQDATAAGAGTTKMIRPGENKSKT